MIISTNQTIAELPHLATFLADCPNAVAGWGRKLSGRRAIWLSKILRRQLALLEDGFVRSVDRHAPSLSLLVDDLGVYYDATRPSRMEHAIGAGADADQAARARALAAQWRDRGISKYNHAADYDGPLSERYVLVVDQTFGDLSIAGGLADEAYFMTMLNTAMADNPACEIVVKVHPDVTKRAKRSCFPASALSRENIRTISEDCHPSRLLCNASAVYTVTSLMGFEALLWGKEVHCFGMPFYAGWGLTHDVLPKPVRRGAAVIEDLVHAALVQLARYADPVTGKAWEPEQAMAYVAEGRAQAAKLRSADQTEPK